MAKSSYFSVGDKAKKIRKAWFGVGDKAKKIKKAWIGVNDKAKLFFSSEPSYYGVATSLGTSRPGSNTISMMSKTKNANYALFCAGNVDAVDAYNKNLTRTSPNNMGARCIKTTGSWVGNYAITDWGYVQGEDESKGYVSYDTSLTRVIGGEFRYKSQERCGAWLPSYALFAGGSNTTMRSTVEILNASLTHSTSGLNEGRESAASATVNNIALVAGGYTGSNSRSKVVDTYNNSLTHSTTTSLSIARIVAASGTVGNYALFISGYDIGNSTSVKNIDVYNGSLTKTSITNDAGSASGNATSLGEYLVFGLGDGSYVSMYDTSLTRTSLSPLTGTGRTYFRAIDIGDYALFAGGGSSTVVDVYAI